MNTLKYLFLFLLLSISLGLIAQDISHLPLFKMEDLIYRGAFRVPASTHNNSSINYSQGPIAYNPDKHSLFMVGHAHHQAIAEFAIPEIVLSDSLADLNFAAAPMQDFHSLLDSVPSGNTQRINRVGGMYYVQDRKDSRLVVNAYEYYDAPGDNTVSTMLIDDATDLANTSTRGYLAFEGGAGHTSGWLSPIPENLHDALAGTHITGQSSGRPIISRFSVGPSAFSFDMDSLLAATTTIPTTKLLDFSLRNRLHPDLPNDSLHNDLWTHLSQVAYGFIVPGTRTYLTVGKSGGHESGICYKCEQDNGNRCGGYCTPIASDNYNHYWLWDVQDLIDVKNGVIESYAVRPYDKGIFDTPFKSQFIGIGGGSFDPISGDLYLTIQKGDTEQGRYARPPVVVVYRAEKVVSNEQAGTSPNITVYPNPTAGNLSFSNLTIGTAINIVDLFGKSQGQFNITSETKTIDISHLPAGAYFAICDQGKANKYQVLKIMKR